MMMPANYSAIAENEVIYGGAGIGDYLPEIWTSKNVKQFSTNVLTILSNSFTSYLVKATLGTMFGGNWGGDNGDKIFGSSGTLTALYKVGRDINGEDQSFLNKVMTTLGLAASVYTLGTTSAKSYVGNKKTITVQNG